MFTESRKTHLLDEVMLISDEKILTELEAVLKNNKKMQAKKKPSIYDFVVIFTKKEGDAVKKAIEETCEKVNPDDWK